MLLYVVASYRMDFHTCMLTKTGLQRGTWPIYLRLHSETRSTRHINSITVTLCDRKWESCSVDVCVFVDTWSLCVKTLPSRQTKTLIDNCVFVCLRTEAVCTWCVCVCWEGCPLPRFVCVNPFLWLDSHSWLPIQSAGRIKNRTNSLKPRPLEAAVLNWINYTLVI